MVDPDAPIAFQKSNVLIGEVAGFRALMSTLTLNDFRSEIQSELRSIVSLESLNRVGITATLPEYSRKANFRRRPLSHRVRSL